MPAIATDSDLPRGPAIGRWTFAAIVLGVVVGIEAVILAIAVIGPDPVWDFGMDYRYYVSLGERWLADGTFYLPHQLTGQPYEAQLLGLDETTSTLYPPSALLFFVPLAVIPDIVSAVVFWTAPIAVTAFVLWKLAPSGRAWFVMLLLLAWPRAIGSFLFGNSDIWMMAAVAGGLLWGWPALAVTLKPTLGPLALVGIRRRAWWVGLAAGLAFAVLTLPMWLDYVTAVRNIRGLDLGYSIGSLPLIIIPLVAWLGRRDRPNGTVADG